MNKIDVKSFQPIGRIRSPYHALEDMPIQPKGACGVQGRIEIKPEYVGGLADVVKLVRVEDHLIYIENVDAGLDTIAGYQTLRIPV